MINLIAMIFMCIVIVGVMLIYGVILLEGSLYVNPMIFVHLTIPAFVLGLNMYVIMLEDKEEYKYFRKGSGFFVMNFAFFISVLALSIAVYMKMLEEKGPLDNNESNNNNNNNTLDEGVLFIEECLIHALAVIESFSLKEYAKAKF